MAASLGDLSGQVFGWWLVLGLAPSSNGNKRWYCHCLNCEPKRGIIGPSIHIVWQSNLVGGLSSQCQACGKTTHGGSYTVEYRIWSRMHRRCESEPTYLEKAIQVCARWTGRDGFRNFLEDMGPRPQGCPYEWSIGRIDPWGDYRPRNCRWETIDQQAREKTTNVILEVNGVRMVQEDWAKEMDICSDTIRYRMAEGKSQAEAVLMTSKVKAPEERTREDGRVERKCKRCGEWVLLSGGYYSNSTGHGGFESVCSECRRAIDRARDTAKRRAAGGKEKYIVPQRMINGSEERWCGACPPNGKWHPLSEFGFKTSTRRRSLCKACHAAQRKVICREPHG